MVDDCQNCGSSTHKTLVCPTEMTTCSFPHCPRIQDPAHSVLMCPSLAAYCGSCKIRGHRDQEHQKWGLDRSPVQLRQQFKQFAHLGKFSCLPFLYGQGQIKNTHFRACLSATALARAQPDLWMYVGLDTKVPESVLKCSKVERDRAIANLHSTPATYNRPTIPEKKV